MFPLAPGVAGGEFVATTHEFVNFNISDVIEDLHQFIDLIHSKNPAIKIILTVSPVPLAATYENKHIMVSSTYSKSVLRVAASEIEAHYPFVTYFPSYEIITGPGQADRYFEDDLRQVTPEGVAHVMRIFQKHFIDDPVGLNPRKWDQSLNRELLNLSTVICDEEEIERSLDSRK
jgi:hypothetical protein